MFIGSEGTLGIITKPDAVAGSAGVSCVGSGAVFTLSRVAATRAISQAGLYPTTVGYSIPLRSSAITSVMQWHDADVGFESAIIH